MAIDINILNTELSAHGTVIICSEFIEQRNFIVVLENVTSNEIDIQNIIESHILGDYPTQISFRLNNGTLKSDYSSII